MVKPTISVAAVLILAVTACTGGSTREKETAGVPLPFNRDEIINVLPPDSIRAIDDPQLVSPSEASEELRSEELVLGLTLGGQARAYPVTVLSAHEIVNDVVAGQAIAVTW